MNLNQLETQTAKNVQPVYNSAIQIFSPYQDRAIPESLWVALLRLLFQIVEPAAYKQAELNRVFYDSERKRQLPHAPLEPVRLAKTSFEGFVREMEDVKKDILKPESSDGNIHSAALRAVRTVENAGRRTIIKAIEDPVDDSDAGFVGKDHVDDDEDNKLPDRLDDFFDYSKEDELEERRERKRRQNQPRTVRGWARVPTGRETCGFCWMLASRGPVYKHDTAGLKISKEKALEKFTKGELTSEFMNQWHTGCDCKVVPVFKTEGWEGYNRYKAAESLWKETTKGLSGRDALNAFRRAAESGEIQKKLIKTTKPLAA